MIIQGDCLVVLKKLPENSVDAVVTELKRVCKERGLKIVVYMARHWDDVGIIEKWMRLHHIPYREVICGKPLGRYIVDDKNLRPEEVDTLWKD